MDNISKVEIAILKELISKRKIGGAHTPLGNIVHRAPDEFLHDKKGKKTIEDALKNLVNKKWVLVLIKKTGKGTGNHISINPRMIKEISEFIQ